MFKRRIVLKVRKVYKVLKVSASILDFIDFQLYGLHHMQCDAPPRLACLIHAASVHPELESNSINK